MEIAHNSGNQNFINELKKFLESINYNENEIYSELKESFQKTKKDI